LKEAEICYRSGLLATNKCYDAVKGPTGDVVQKRTTYMEIATEAQMPKEPCNVHGEPHTRIVTEPGIQGSEAPRAELAADLSELKPIALKGPTLLAQNDPYNSIKSTVTIEATESEQTPENRQTTDDRQTHVASDDVRNQKADSPTNEDGKPVLRAIPVEPKPEETPVEIRRAIPVGPMDEVDQGALLKAATPSPGTSDDE
jgi:hypothetical protein